MTEFKYLSEVKGKNGIVARVVAKSKGVWFDEELVCWEYEAPKCILAEINTHGMLCKNAQSSRAVPVERVIEQVKNNPVIPVHWGKNQKGMVAKEELDAPVTLKDGRVLSREEAWLEWAKVNVEFAEAFDTAGYHKQIVNRPLEAFTLVKGVISATDFDNFFHLRYHPDADPYMYELAKCMWEAYELAEAEMLHDGEWHTPYYKDGAWKPCNLHNVAETEMDKYGHTLEEALEISAVGCAQVSFRNLDLSEETVDKVWKTLMEGEIIHGSVTQHQGKPWTGLARRTNAQFTNWVMFRKTLPNENCTRFHLRDKKNAE